MFNYNNLFEKELRKLITEEIERLKDNVSNGLSVVDYSDYKHQVGKIAGLRTVLELCDMVQSELSKR
jgi:hypothetical protein